MARLLSRRSRRLAEDLDGKLEQARAARLPLERQWLLNLAFYLGQQWVEWNPVKRTLQKVEVPPWRVLLTINLIRPTIRTELAKLIKQKPTVAVQPRSGDPDDVAQAKASEKILEFLWRQTGTYKEHKEALLWSLICGTGFLKIYWDPDKGDEVAPGLPMGEICVEAESPFAVFPDPLATKMRHAGWVFHLKVRSQEYVLDKYGVKLEPEPLQDDLLDSKILSLYGQTGGPREGIVIKEFWQRPTSEHQEGRYVVYANEQILYEGPNPYPRVPIPFVAIPHIPVPGRLWGDSVITDLIDPQKNYNKSRSQAVEIRNLSAKPKWLVPKGSIDRPITTAPAEQIEYIPIAGYRPEPILGREVPTTYWRDLEQSRNEIYEVSGQHEVSRSIVPSRVRSGIAIAYLQEQDDTRLVHTAQAYEEAIEELETYKLHLARQFYIEPRVARIIGENNVIEVIEFTRDDIPENADVMVIAGSSLPQSRVARQEFILELWRQRIIQDPRTILKLLEFGDVEGVYEDVNLDSGQAQRENELLKMGIWHQPEDFENHEVHILEHNRFRKTEAYDQLPDEIKSLFAQHVAMHQQMMMQQTSQVLASLLAGGGEQEGGPPQSALESPVTLAGIGQQSLPGRQATGSAVYPQRSSLASAIQEGVPRPPLP